MRTKTLLMLPVLRLWSSPGDWSLLDEGRRQQRIKEDLGDCLVHTPHLASLQACVVQKCERCPCRVAPKYNLESGCQGWSPVQFSGGCQRRGATIKVKLIRSSDVIRRRLNLHNPKPNTKFNLVSNLFYLITFLFFHFISLKSLGVWSTYGINI